MKMKNTAVIPAKNIKRNLRYFLLIGCTHFRCDEIWASENTVNIIDKIVCTSLHCAWFNCKILWLFVCGKFASKIPDPTIREKLTNNKMFKMNWMRFFFIFFDFCNYYCSKMKKNNKRIFLPDKRLKLYYRETKSIGSYQG